MEYETTDKHSEECMAVILILNLQYFTYGGEEDEIILHFIILTNIM